MTLSIHFFSRVIISCSVLLLFPGCSSLKRAPDALKISDDLPVIAEGYTIAVLPVVNLSARKAPLKEIREVLAEDLRKQGISILDSEVLERFMERRRMRNTSGIDTATAKAFADETGGQAVLVNSLEHYDETYPPKIALTSRLVSTGNKADILWTDSIGLAGDDSPGILGLGLIKDSGELIKIASQHLSVSLAGYLSDPEHRVIVPQKDEADERFLPKVYPYNSLYIDPGKKYTMAVLPFFNRSERKYAGEIIALHFVREMLKYENFHIAEPGMIREAFLKFRVIMNDGISLENAERMFSRLNVDFILTGTVADYEDYQGTYGAPKVDFSIFLIARKSREVVWTSKSHNSGSDGVVFFDLGKINTAHSMASEMVKAAVNVMIEQ